MHEDDEYACVVRHVDFTDPEAQNIPLELTPGQTFNIERNFVMPTGVMNGLTFVIGKLIFVIGNLIFVISKLAFVMGKTHS